MLNFILKKIGMTKSSPAKRRLSIGKLSRIGRKEFVQNFQKNLKDDSGVIVKLKFLAVTAGTEGILFYVKKMQS